MIKKIGAMHLDVGTPATTQEYHASETLATVVSQLAQEQGWPVETVLAALVHEIYELAQEQGWPVDTVRAALMHELGHHVSMEHHDLG